MSRYTYAGLFKNPTKDWFAKENDEGMFEIWARSDRKEDGSAEPDHKHTSAPTFSDESEAIEWIENMQQFFEDDYDEYLEENSSELARMEMYEMWRNER